MVEEVKEKLMEKEVREYIADNSLADLQMRRQFEERKAIGPTPEKEAEKMDEAKEEATKCTLCGLCRTSCPVYRLTLNECVAPRGKATLLKQDMPSKYLYLCTLCKACELACTLKDIDLVKKVREYRKELVNRGIIPQANKDMISNIRQTGNALGIVEKGKKLDLFCC